MATEKTINARMQMKTDTALNWSKAINFIPKKGEIIIYEADSDYGYERMKIGDGSTKVNDLPFVIGAKDWNQNDPTASDYIKNRPGGIPATTETIFDGDVTLMSDSGRYSVEIEPAEFVLEADCEYEVTLGNATFVTECVYTKDTNSESYILRDMIANNIVGYVAMNDDSSTVNVIVSNVDISHITVKKIIVPMQKFPVEYIPDVFCKKTIFYTNTSGGSVPYALYTDSSLTTLATNDELANSYIKGVVCIRNVMYASIKKMITVTSCEITSEGVGYNDRMFGTLAPLS